MDAKDMQVAPMEKQDEEVGERNGGAGLFVVSGCSIVLSAASIGCLIPWFTRTGISDLQAILAEGNSEYATDFLMPYVIIGGAAMGVIGGVVAGVGGHMKSRPIGIVSLILILIGAGMILGPSAYLNFVLDDTFVRLQQNPTDAGVSFTPKEQSLLDMTAAMYNTCCFAVYDPRCGTRYNDPVDANCNELNEFAAPGVGVDINQHGGSASIRDNQLPVRECSDPNVCAASVFPDITNIISGITSLLCTCYSSAANLAAWNAVFTKLDSCNTMRNLKAINVGPVDIPKTPLKFGDLQKTLSIPIGRPPLQPCPAADPGVLATCASSIQDVAVVGKMWAPEVIYPPEDIPETPGWSCGFGYSKSVAFTMYLALEQASEIGIYGGFATGGIMAFVVIMEVFYWTLGGGSDDDDWNMDHYQDGGYN